MCFKLALDIVGFRVPIVAGLVLATILLSAAVVDSLGGLGIVLERILAKSTLTREYCEDCYEASEYFID